MFPTQRMRRLRQKKIRPLVEEKTLDAADLVAPLFVDETIAAEQPIAAMPGQYRYPVDAVGRKAAELAEIGIRAVLLFGVPAAKDPEASGAFDPEGVVQRAVREVHRCVPDVAIATDVCACEYTSHGHCGIVRECRDGPDLANDESLALIAKIAASHAEAGADIVAPSCMLDGQVAVCREVLDDAGRGDVLIMSYSSKFASSFYGPFREAAGSVAQFGDRRTYQIPPANLREAVRESELDAIEGADILLVKPAGYYLDVVAEVASIGLPVAAYQVSGEYAMIRAAASRGWLDEKAAALESLLACRRAGADLVITYFAEAAAGWLDGE